MSTGSERRRTRRTHSRQLAVCRAGDAPAEVLNADDREALVVELCAAGWTDTQIAAHTRLSTYTTARIRARAGRIPNKRQ